jgi:hypothetical protein
MVKFLRTQPEAARRLLPERLHSYLEKRLNVAAWYPEEDMIGLVRALAELMPGSREDALVRIGRLNARMHLQGACAHLLSDARPDALPVRAVALWQTMHDTGDFRMSVADGEAEARLSAKVAETACCRAGASECRWRIAWTSAPRSEGAR